MRVSTRSRPYLLRGWLCLNLVGEPHTTTHKTIKSDDMSISRYMTSESGRKELYMVWGGIMKYNNQKTRHFEFPAFLTLCTIDPADVVKHVSILLNRWDTRLRRLFVKNTFPFLEKAFSSILRARSIARSLDSFSSLKKTSVDHRMNLGECSLLEISLFCEKVLWITNVFD